MASYNVLRHTHSRFESPAKIFAKLKSKVQKETIDQNERVGFPEDRRLNGRDNFGARNVSSRTEKQNAWVSDGPGDNQKLDAFSGKDNPMTLSPILSPQKTLEYNCRPIHDAHAGSERSCPVYMESTAVSQPSSGTGDGDFSGLGCQRFTPIKEPRNGFDRKMASLINPTIPFSPERNPTSKRTLEQHRLDKVTQIKGPIYVNQSPQKGKKASYLMEDEPCMDGSALRSGHVRGVCKSKEPHQLKLRPRGIPVKDCSILTDKLPIMSPAKMFAAMKERETKRQQVEHFYSGKRDLTADGNLQQKESVPLDQCEMDIDSLGDVTDRVVPSHQLSANTLDSQSADSCSDHVPVLTKDLVEDPLILKSPEVSIPKRRPHLFGLRQWPQQKKFPVENVVYLKLWFLRRNSKGLFVDGIHRDDNIPWNSNIITERISKSVLKTVSGRVYILVGSMKMNHVSEFPKSLLKAFADGFPVNWKELYEKFLESKEHEKENEKTGMKMKALSEPASVEGSACKPRQKYFKTPDQCPPSSTSSTKTSRSGRTLRPPLEYWKGGRVTLDAHMNVTIHEDYETFAHANPTAKSHATSKAPAQTPLSSDEGKTQNKRSKPTKTEEEPAVIVRKATTRQRKVKPVRKSDQSFASADAPVEARVSPEEELRTAARFRRRVNHQTSKRGSHVDTELEKRGKMSSKAQKNKAGVLNTESIRTLRSSSDNWADEELVVKRGKQQKRMSAKEAKEVQKKTKQKSNQLPQQPSQEDSIPPVAVKQQERQPRRTAGRKRKGGEELTKPLENKSTERTLVTKPELETKLSSKNTRRKKGKPAAPQEQEEDEWTEEELKKLRDCVSLHPKYEAGYWEKVAWAVGTRTAEECHNKHTSQGMSRSPAKKNRKQTKEKVEAPVSGPPERPVITARAGTLKRKQQVREFLEVLPKEDMNDAFSSTYMRNKLPKITFSPSDDFDSIIPELDPQTPVSANFPEIKTPRCLHITPGMMGSPNTNSDDKYVFKLQKRMRKNQFNVHKTSGPSKFVATPGVKKVIRRCSDKEDFPFVVWEEFPGADDDRCDSEEEEDYYFGDD